MRLFCHDDSNPKPLELLKKNEIPGGIGLAISLRRGMKRQRFKILAGLFLSLIAAPFVQASEYSFGCQDFTRILSFVQQEHLRFQVMKQSELDALVTEAIQNIPEKMREQGHHMMAAEFERQLVDTLSNTNFSSTTDLCHRLRSGLNRLMMLKSFIGSLDPYSDFYLESELQRKTSVVNGHFVGVGIGTKNEEQYLRITEVVEDGPAFGNLFVGDQITHIDSYSVRGLNRAELRQRIRGELGTQVQFSGIRAEGKKFDTTITRGHVFQKSVSHRWLDQGIVHIRIHRFYAQTGRQVREILEDPTKKRKGIILDLRDNPGGLLQGARDLVDLFVSQGVVVYLRGTYDDQLWALSGKAHTKTPMVVLVNEKTASASEIVAGALQDYGRAVVVGRQTYGKSCVQNIYDSQTALGTIYRGGLKLTTLWYYLPSGRSVKNLQPDLSIPYAKGEEVPERVAMPFEWPSQIKVYPLARNRMPKLSEVVEGFQSKLADQSSEELSRNLILQLLADRNNSSN